MAISNVDQAQAIKAALKLLRRRAIVALPPWHTAIAHLDPEDVYRKHYETLPAEVQRVIPVLEQNESLRQQIFRRETAVPVMVRITLGEINGVLSVSIPRPRTTNTATINLLQQVWLRHGVEVPWCDLPRPLLFYGTSEMQKHSSIVVQVNGENMYPIAAHVNRQILFAIELRAYLINLQQVLGESASWAGAYRKMHILEPWWGAISGCADRVQRKPKPPAPEYELLTYAMSEAMMLPEGAPYKDHAPLLA